MRWLFRLKRHKKTDKACPKSAKRTETAGCESERDYNPCNLYFRKIIEQIIAQYGQEYRQLHLAVIDTEAADVTDKIDSAEEEYLIRQMIPGLNYCAIYTNRPEYFSRMADEWFLEHGLLSELKGKSEVFTIQEGLILDFERGKGIPARQNVQDTIYIPIYKRAWKQRENLDITVPIGYNTVIVKGTKNSTYETFQDRLEREFYAE